MPVTAFMMLYERASFCEVVPFSESLKPILAAPWMALTNLLMRLNLARCSSWVWVFASWCDWVRPRMVDLPFQKPPMTVPTLPEKPPRMPCLIFPIVNWFLKVNKLVLFGFN